MGDSQGAPRHIVSRRAPDGRGKVPLLPAARVATKAGADAGHLAPAVVNVGPNALAPPGHPWGLPQLVAKRR